MIHFFFLVRDLYERKRHNASLEPWRPHIVLYIDANKEQCLKNIKKRNRVSRITFFHIMLNSLLLL